MRQISLIKNALTFTPKRKEFETKRKYISSETPLRFNPNVKAFFTRKKSSKNNVRSPGKLTGNCGRFFVYKIIRMLRKPYGRALQYLLLKSDAGYLQCRHH